MLDVLLEPFQYEYMQKAIIVSGSVGIVCAFLSAFLMLKGWSLIGDALSHAVVPGVAIAYVLKFPYAIGAFFSGILAALAILGVKGATYIKEDAVIGFIFTTFFALGMFIVSIHPTAVDINAIILGNILGIADEDLIQIAIIITLSLTALVLFWKPLLLIFFDEHHARTVGISPLKYKVLFFTLLSACVVSALQTVGAILVIAMVVTPGATAYLLSDKFSRLILIAISIGGFTSAFGAYLSYFLNGATGALIVSLQLLIFLTVFFFAPKYGLINKHRSSTRTLISPTDYREMKND